VTERSALRLYFVHAVRLNRGGFFAGLLDLQEHSTATSNAEQVRDSSELIRPAVNLHHPPAELFGFPNNRGNDG
jgi:hypothetical protein